MKTGIFIFLILLTSVSCSVLDDNCLCTDEFCYYTVTVVDTLGVPVDSLTVSIKDKNGNKLDVNQPGYIFNPGVYVVLDDSFINMFEFTERAEKVFFSATDGERIAQAEYLFNSDRCRCHVNKVSGPDTLVLK